MPGIRTQVSESFLHVYLSRCRRDVDDRTLPLVYRAIGTTAASHNDQPCRLRRVDMELSLEQRAPVQDGLQ